MKRQHEQKDALLRGHFPECLGPNSVLSPHNTLSSIKRPLEVDDVYEM